MNLYRVDFDVKDLEKFKAAPILLPDFVVADSFKEAQKLAGKYESDNLDLREIKVEIENFVAATPRGYKGISNGG